MSNILVTTETGSVYEIDLNDWYIRRIEYSHDLRRDGEWLRMLNKPNMRVGEPVLMVLEPLGHGNVTYRTTSPVVRIDEKENIPDDV